MEEQIQMHDAAELRAVAHNEALSAEERDVAAKLLETLEAPKPTPKSVSISEMLAQTFADITARADAYRAEQLARFKVCSGCCLKQAEENDICELCGVQGPWEPPVPDSAERTRYIAASTTYSDDELNDHIARDAMNTAFVTHCARVLELRGVERVKSFWEKAGFTITGAPLAK